MSPFLMESATNAGIASWPLSRCMKPRMLPCMYAWLHAFSNWRHSCIISYADWKSPSSIESYFLSSSSLMPNSTSRRARRLDQSIDGRGRIWSSTTSRFGRIVPAVKSTVSVPAAMVGTSCARVLGGMIVAGGRTAGRFHHEREGLVDNRALVGRGRQDTARREADHRRIGEVQHQTNSRREEPEEAEVSLRGSQYFAWVNISGSPAGRPSEKKGKRRLLHSPIPQPQGAFVRGCKPAHSAARAALART